MWNKNAAVVRVCEKVSLVWNFEVNLTYHSFLHGGRPGDQMRVSVLRVAPQHLGDRVVSANDSVDK